MAWPGKLTLTDKAIYFEGAGLLGNKRVMRLDLTYDGLRVEKAKVGPLGSSLFDSGSESNWWVLEFIDLGGAMRKCLPAEVDEISILGVYTSTSFWKNTSTNGLVLSKNHVVADLTLTERAAKTSKQKYQVVEKTQATIDAATLKGIPSNIDLFKELIFPITLTAKNFENLRHWEEPQLTVGFLGLIYTLIFRNLLSYIFPVMLMITTVGMLTIRSLEEQGRLGRFFGGFMIRDQPPSNTIQKIIAVKDAMRDIKESEFKCGWRIL